MPGNNRFLRALAREPVDAVPVWIMRQAGRYLPEYRATRAKAGDFLTLCKTPELACEVTLQPLARYPLDAAIVFSDILTIPDAMGLGLSLAEGIGPRFAKPIIEPAMVDALGIPDPESDLGYVADAIRLIKHELNDSVPLIGFCGSPWTLATYMIEGGSGHDFKRVKRFLYDEPEALHRLLDLVAQASLEYLKAQVQAGADALMIFDTWGGVLTTPAYETFSLAYMRKIIEGLPPDIPTIAFTKGGGMWLEQIAATNCYAVGLDWSIDIAAAKRRIGDRVALQGNMDPAILRASRPVIEAEAESIISAFGPQPGHIFNLGHGITPDIDPDHVGYLIEHVHAYSRAKLATASTER